MKLTFSPLGLLLLVSAPSFALTLKQGDQHWQIDPTHWPSASSKTHKLSLSTKAAYR